jgi:hypothetical protein
MAKIFARRSARCQSDRGVILVDLVIVLAVLVALAVFAALDALDARRGVLQSVMARRPTPRRRSGARRWSGA